MNFIVDQPIAQWKSGDTIRNFVILKQASSRVTRSGQPYLHMVLQDVSGQITGKFWSYQGDIGEADGGSVVRVQGLVKEYQNLPELTVEKLRRITPEDPVDMSLLVPVAPIDVDAWLQEIEDTVASLEDPDYRAVATEMMNRHQQQLASIPAGLSVHHAFLHGLLMHTGNMLKVAKALAVIYQDVVNRDLLLTGTLLHDFAKSREFTISQLGLVQEYSVEGQLLGHLVMGAMELGEVCDSLGVPEEKKLLLQHMLLSHHGKPELGAAVPPRCAEGELLHHIDMLDSRMEIYRENLKDIPEGEFSPRKVFPLDTRIFHPTGSAREEQPPLEGPVLFR